MRTLPLSQPSRMYGSEAPGSRATELMTSPCSPRGPGHKCKDPHLQEQFRQSWQGKRWVLPCRAVPGTASCIRGERFVRGSQARGAAASATPAAHRREGTRQRRHTWSQIEVSRRRCTAEKSWMSPSRVTRSSAPRLGRKHRCCVGEREAERSVASTPGRPMSTMRPSLVPTCRYGEESEHAGWEIWAGLCL